MIKVHRVDMKCCGWRGRHRHSAGNDFSKEWEISSSSFSPFARRINSILFPTLDYVSKVGNLCLMIISVFNCEFFALVVVLVISVVINRSETF
jgi:hypothetical protein